MNEPAEVQFSLHGGPRRQRSSSENARRPPRVTQVLAMAVSFQEMMAKGDAKNYRELARRAGVSVERLSQAMKLLWLSPVIQEEILYLRSGSGRYPVTELALRRIAAKWSWAEQLELWTRLKEELHIEAS